MEPSRRKQLLWLLGLVGLGVGIALCGYLLSRREPSAPLQADAGLPAEPTTKDAEAAAPVVFDAAVLGLGHDQRVRPPTRRITSREIRALHQRNGGQIKYCYDKVARRAAPLVQRRSDVTVYLAPYGKVARVDVRAGDRELEACLKRFIKRWRFARSLGEQRVDFPIVFAR